MISVDSKQFRQAAVLAGQVVERRNTIPVLDAIRARANGRLELSGTDLDTQVDVTLPCEKRDRQDAAFLLGGHRHVLKAIGAAGGKDVRLSPVDGGLGIKAGALALDMKVAAKEEDWPPLAAMREEFSARLSGEHLRQIERVLPGMSTEETRYYLNGVYLHHEKDWTWRAVTTDGHRLFIAELALPDATGALPSIEGAKDWSKGVIIPRKAILMAVAALRKSGEDICFRAGGMLLANSVDSTAPARGGCPIVSFEAGLGDLQYRLSTKCIDGGYPDYRRVVPSEQNFGLTAPIARLRQAIDAVGYSGGSRCGAIRIAFFEGEIELSMAYAPEAMTARYRMPAEHDAPKDFSIGFNSAYLRDCLNVLRGENVFFGLTDSAAPTIIRDPDETGFLCVLMPMRV